jgi:hypothetical protein
MDTVSLPVGLVMCMHGRRLELRAALHYDQKEPYQVKILFPPGRQHLDVVLARELLANGTVEPATFGCMRVWPSGGDIGTVCIGYETPAGDARLEIPAFSVMCFLDMANVLVPEGREPDRTDTDATIRAIPAEGGPR